MSAGTQGRSTHALATAFSLAGALGSAVRADVFDGRQCSLAVVSDLDGDAQPDLVVRLDARGGAARFVVVSGRDGHIVRELVTDGLEPGFGNSFAMSSDLDHDGVPDLVVGTERRGALAFSGSNGRLLWQCHARAQTPGCGLRVACGVDIDADGVGDVLVGACGDVRIVSGASGRELRTLTREFCTVDPEGAPKNTRVPLGPEVALVGDLDGDGLGDVLTGTPEVDGARPSRVDAFSSASGRPLFSFWAPHGENALGTPIGALGDLDGDGVCDVFASAQDQRERAVFALSGRDGHELLVLRLGGDFEAFGSSVAPLADLDGDGRPDLAVGACETDLTPDFFDTGLAEVYGGRSGRLVSEVLRSDAEGCELAALPDVDGDGNPDLVVARILCRGEERTWGAMTLELHSGRTGLPQLWRTAIDANARRR